LNEKEKEASDKYDDLRGYDVDYFVGELRMSEAESILFFVCDGDVLSQMKIKIKMKRKKVLKYYYHKRIARLNELLTGIEQLAHIGKEN